mmetsp:Transcript_20630/g.52237  ORF Transcript_20630/g.52237 Transcript_20630/m.52237 type:complete len:193 (-) Transcript_20630:388-966(-)
MLVYALEDWLGWISNAAGLSMVADQSEPAVPILVLFTAFSASVGISVICLLLVVLFLIRHHIRVYGELKEAMSRAFSEYWRLLVMLVGIDFVFGYALVYGWWVYALNVNGVEKAEEYFTCQVLGGKDCYYNDSPPFAVIFIMWALLPSVGIFMFITFHTGRVMRTWWLVLFRTGRISTSTDELFQHTTSHSV